MIIYFLGYVGESGSSTYWVPGDAFIFICKGYLDTVNLQWKVDAGNGNVLRLVVQDRWHKVEILKAKSSSAFKDWVYFLDVGFG